MSTAPAPVSHASVCSRKDMFQFGKVRIGEYVRGPASVSIASVWAWPQGTFKRLAVLLRKRETRGRSKTGARTEL